MTPTEHPPKTPSLRTGFFAVLAGLLRVQGSGLSKITQGIDASKIISAFPLKNSAAVAINRAVDGARAADNQLPPAGALRGARGRGTTRAGSGTVRTRRLFVGVVSASTLLGALLFNAAAFAAGPPEKPELNVKPVFASIAVFNGTLSPSGLVPAEGTYEFLYAASKTTCVGGSETAPGLALGGAPETLPPEQIKGLAPSTEYTACLEIENESITAKSPPVTFKTTAAAKPEAPEATEVSERKATTATLNGVVNPKAEGEPGHYRLLYRESVSEPGKCTGVGEVETPEEPASGSLGQGVSAAVTGLAAGEPYSFCVKALNALGEATVSTAMTFTAAIEPETPEARPASEVTSSTATFNGVLNPANAGEPGKYAFVYRQSATECQGEGEQSTTPEPSTATSPQPVSAKITGLQPGAPYSFCLRVENQAGETALSAAEPLTLTPSVEAEEATELTETTAVLHATINPDSSAVTSCAVEYGTSTEYDSSVPCEPATLAAGTAAEPITARLSKLSPNREYHWRIVTTNTAGTTTTVDQTFSDLITTTPEPCPNAQLRKENNSTTLPDCRAYEMVTPAQKNGALLGGLFSIHVPGVVAPGGTRVIGSADQCFAQAQSCNAFRAREGEPYLFERSAAGWVTHPLAPPASSYEVNTPLAVNVEAATALFGVPSSPDGPDDLLGRQPDGSFAQVGPLGEPKPGNASEQALSVFITEGVYATANLGHVIYGTYKPLWSADIGDAGLYEYAPGVSHAEPLMVGVDGGAGTRQRVSVCETVLGGLEAPSRDEAVSEDGRTVYFAAAGRADGECHTGPPATWLYARVDGELPDAHTVLISGPAATGCTEAKCLEDTSNEEDFRTSNFEGASSDGTRVLFTDTQQLTNGASESAGNAFLGCNKNAEVGGCNLYESVCAEPCGTPAEAPAASGRRLIDISEGAKETGGPRVQGVMAISADGSHVYFVAKGVLTGEEQNQRGEKAQNEEDNLYLYAEGHLTFITRLSPSDEQENQWGFKKNLTANVTPDGRFLVFTDDRALTADDTRPEGGASDAGEHAAQVFEYDAQAGTLTRISIGQGGYNDNGNMAVGDANIAAASLGGNNDGEVQARRDPTMSEDGSFVFFESPIALTPGALNDVPIQDEESGAHFAQNVYEYHDGRVSLISDGGDTTGEGANEGSASLSPTGLLGASASGRDVFFSTFDQLVPGDSDDLRDYYDARIEGGFPASAAPTPCEANCHGAGGSPGSEGSPASESFTGPGNLSAPVSAPPKAKTAAQIRAEKLAKALKSCRKDRKKPKRRKCERQARKSYGTAAKAKSTRRANSNRRAAR